VANKAKSAKTSEKDRRARVEAMRREQAAKERRKSTLFVVIAVIVGLGLVAAAAVPAILKNRNDPAKKALSSFGVSTAAASCSAATNDKPSGGQDHKAQGTVVAYDHVPPSSGAHWAVPAISSRAFYTTKDRPAMEELVHNLEHGYTVLWYDSSVKGAQLSALEDIAVSARSQKAVGPSKFIVSAWDPAYGAFPAGKHIAMSHWGAKTAHRQLCGQVSGPAVASFVKRFPYTDSPEPAGQ
jgi:Protein of unknown function (DUF3105)